MSITKTWISWAPQLRSLLRIAAAVMFFQSGTVKLFGWPMGMPDHSTVVLWTQIGIGALLEFVGGALLIVGLFTRPVAFIMAGQMAVAYFQFHQPKGVWPVENGGTTAVLYSFLWFYFSAAGAGIWSLDHMRSHRNRHLTK